jgi:hypothetical protein
MALIAIGGFWTVAGRMLLTPPIRTLAAPLYGLTARHRHHCREDRLLATSTMARRAT